MMNENLVVKITGYRLRKKSSGICPRIYLFPEGESVLQNLFNRRDRPYNAYRPLVLEELSKAGFKDATIRWSQKAGCECGCSPGFIWSNGANFPCDLFMDYTIEDES